MRQITRQPQGWSLHGRELRTGDALQLALEDGGWVPCAFVDDVVQPLVRLGVLQGAAEFPAEGLLLRWPRTQDQAAHAQRVCGVWNELHPLGTQVRYWPGVREGSGTVSRTRSRAWPLASRHPVVMVEGYAGGISLSHVEVLS